MHQQSIPAGSPQTPATILLELLDGIRQAPTLADVNIAAGIAYDEMVAAMPARA